MARFKSLKQTRWTRFRAFLRGVLLYNTVYWKRASDEVDRSASRVGREERAKRRPQVDPELLRPRVRPGGEVPRTESRGNPSGDAMPHEAKVPGPRRALPALSDELSGNHFPDAADHLRGDEGRTQRRRRVMRRRELRDKAVDPGRILRDRAGDAKSKRPMPGWWRWLIGWHR